MRYADRWPIYAKWWDSMVINPDRVPEFSREATFALANKATYETVAEVTGVPWVMIAVIHRRESNANFNTYLGNGQSLSQQTTITPVGRGPFTGPNAFLNGSIDAIRQEGWGSIIDWRLEKMLYYEMLFNGPGYDMKGLPSPYLFGGTNIQKPGKYIGDDEFDPTVMDTQPGCAPLMQMIAKLDPTVIFTRES